MSFARALNRLRDAVVTHHRGRGSDTSVVQKRDLAELLQDYDRIDAAYRDLYSRAQQSSAVPDGWRVEPIVDNGVKALIVRAPRINGVRTNAVVFPDDDNPAHRLLAIILSAPATVQGVNQQLLEALEDIANDYADRFDMESPSTNPGMKFVVEQARAAIAAARQEASSHD